MCDTKRVIRHENDSKLFVPIVVLSLTASIGLIKAKNCPALMCQCKWTNGKETAFCDNRSLNSIPVGIPVSTQVLNISDNKLKTLESQVFRERGLINLQKIFMSKCKLDHLSDDSLVQLTNLIEIDLCDNQLKDIPTLSLQKCKFLRKLWLCLNPIVVIRSDAFDNLTSLVNIDLSKCQINSVESNAFRGLNQLRYLKLNRNRLTTLPTNALTVLPVLHSLDLNDNRWQCDCKLTLSINWLLNYNIPQSIWPKCYQPQHLHGLNWNQLNTSQIACSPQFHSQTTELEANIGQNITIKCIASGVPLPSISWKFIDVQDTFNRIRSNDNEKRYNISLETFNETFAISYMRINGLTSHDSQTLLCIATNKGGAVHQNISLVVKQMKRYQLNIDSDQVPLFSYLVFLIIVFIFAIFLITLLRIKSKRCPNIVTISSTNLSPKFNRIDILQNCNNYHNCDDIQNKNIVSNKTEIALISDIIKDTNHLKAYRFWSETFTPDVTRFGPQLSANVTQTNKESPTLSTNDSLTTFGLTPTLFTIDSTQVTYNNCLINVSLDQFSSDNRFKYKKLNSFNNNPIDECNDNNERPKYANSSLNDIPLAIVQHSPPLFKNSVKPLKSLYDSPNISSNINNLESDKQLIESDLKANNDSNVSITRV